MSRSYAIAVPINLVLSESFREKMQSFKIDFTLLEILPKDIMLNMLKEKLLDNGFTITEEGLKMPTDKNKNVIFDLEKTQLKLSIELPESINMYFNDDFINDTITAKVINTAIVEGKDLPKAEIHSINSEFANIMTSFALEAKSIINIAIKEVYKEAIVIKAKELGSINTLQETESGGIYKIHLEIQN